MPTTQPTGRQIKDASIQRDDLDSVTVGQAVVRKIVQGANINLNSTGADSGTGDVTIAVTGIIDPVMSGAVGSEVVVDQNGDYISAGGHSGQAINHILEAWVFPSAAARVAAGLYVASDVGRIAYQLDTGQYFRLTATTPTWQPLPASFFPTTLGVAGSELRSDGAGIIYDPPPTILRVKSAVFTYLSSLSAVPADVATISLPSWLTRWRPNTFEILTVTSGGTLAGGNFNVYDNAAGAGNALFTAIAPQNTAGQFTASAAASGILTYTSQTIYVRQLSTSQQPFSTVQCFVVLSALF